MEKTPKRIICVRTPTVAYESDTKVNNIDENVISLDSKSIFHQTKEIFTYIYKKHRITKQSPYKFENLVLSDQKKIAKDKLERKPKVHIRHQMKLKILKISDPSSQVAEIRIHENECRNHLSQAIFRSRSIERIKHDKKSSKYEKFFCCKKALKNNFRSLTPSIKKTQINV